MVKKNPYIYIYIYIYIYPQDGEEEMMQQLGHFQKEKKEPTTQQDLRRVGN